MMTAAALGAALALYAPVVVHDERERSPLAPVAQAPAAVPGLDPDPRAAVYGRVVRRDDGGAWLQYWLFYADQDQDRGIVRTGRHAGDWEMVQYRLDARGRPREAVYAQHSIAERCGWGTVQQRDGRPVVYAARGAHASYFRPGTRDRMWPDPNDEANGRGRVVRARVVRISEGSPAWMRWPEPWGRARARWWNPAEQDSPRGPAFQEQGRWSDPDGWARSATDCRAECDRVGECDGRERALAGVGTAAVLALVGGVWWRRSRWAR